jgi:hypothetical protein
MPQALCGSRRAVASGSIGNLTFEAALKPPWFAPVGRVALTERLARGKAGGASVF